MKALLKKIPGLYRFNKLLKRVYWSKVILPRKTAYIKTVKQDIAGRPKVNFSGDNRSDYIICFTSYPARIKNIVLTVESLFSQTKPAFKIILVLSGEEFVDRKLPDSVCNLVERGLEILWVEKNTRSYKKLLPVQAAYPNKNIITVDDDILYLPDFLENLISASKQYPNSVIGNRGRSIQKDIDHFKSYIEWPLIFRQSKGKLILLTGMGGILYPPGKLNTQLLQDIELAQKLCPDADDFWFWAVSVYSDVTIVCTGLETYVDPEVEVPKESLTSKNVLQGGNDRQFLAVLDFFKIEL